MPDQSLQHSSINYNRKRLCKFAGQPTNKQQVLYNLLKPFIRFCLKAFFRNIVVLGKENLYLDGPAIFVSNHPNAFLDPLILATAYKKQFHYIAGAEWFGKGLKNYIFRHEFNMIPVVRPWLKSGEKVSNDEMFDQCYKALAEGKKIVIYPEGTSVTVSKIRELKTGSIRIKVGGDRYLNKTASSWKEVKIIPVGVNYYNPRSFQSDVILNIGAHIDYSHIEESDEKEQVRLMTEHTREKMSELVFHFEEEGLGDLAKEIYRIYGMQLKGRYHIEDKNMAGKFQLQKDILNAVLYFQKNKPSLVDQFQQKAKELMTKLRENRLDIRFLGDYRWPWFLLLRLLFGLPFFISGWMLNIIPYKLTRWVFERFLRPKFATTYEAGKLNPSFLASMAFLLGMILFILWYVVLSIGLIIETGHFYWIPVLIVGGYLLGVYAAQYAKTAYDFYHMILVVNRRRKRKQAFQGIRQQWEELKSQLDRFHREYIVARSNS